MGEMIRGVFSMWTVLIVIAIFAPCKSNQLKTSLTFELPDNENTCFYQEFTGSTRYVFGYNVIAGGANDVDVALNSPNGKILYKETKRKSDEFRFETSPGTYEFCFSNEFSTFTHKIIHFSLEPEVRKTLAEEGGDGKATVNTQAEESLEEIHLAVGRVFGYQTEYKLNEARGRHNAELLNKRVQWWSALESCVILVTGIGQMFVLRTFFTLYRTGVKGTSGTLVNTAL